MCLPAGGGFHDVWLWIILTYYHSVKNASASVSIHPSSASIFNNEVHPIDRPPRLLGERLLHPTVGGPPPALPGGRGGRGPTARLLRLRHRVGSEQEQAQGRIADQVVRVARARRRRRRRRRRRIRFRIRIRPPRCSSRVVVVDDGGRGGGEGPPAEAHHRRRAREREGNAVRANQGQVRR